MGKGLLVFMVEAYADGTEPRKIVLGFTFNLMLFSSYPRVLLVLSLPDELSDDRHFFTQLGKPRCGDPAYFGSPYPKTD